MSQITPPFTAEQVAGLIAWQECGWVHPFTCCDHQTMRAEPRGLVCPKCERVQTWAHDFMAEGAPPNPFAHLHCDECAPEFTCWASRGLCRKNAKK